MKNEQHSDVKLKLVRYRPLNSRRFTRSDALSKELPCWVAGALALSFSAFRVAVEDDGGSAKECGWQKPERVGNASRDA
jgi:hypothetical protein